MADKRKSKLVGKVQIAAAKGLTVMPSAVRLLELPQDRSRAGLTAFATEQYALGTRAGVRMAVAVALLRADFGQDYKGWLGHCEERWGLAKRTLDRMARAGGFLARRVPSYPQLAQVGDLQKLEELDTLPEGELKMLVERHGDELDKLPREALRKVVKDYRKAAGLEEPEDGEAEDGGQQAEDAEPKPAKGPKDALAELKQFDPARLVPSVEFGYAMAYAQRFLAACQARPEIAPRQELTVFRAMCVAVEAKINQVWPELEG
jgi:hypothetical protein